MTAVPDSSVVTPSGMVINQILSNEVWRLGSLAQPGLIITDARNDIFDPI